MSLFIFAISNQSQSLNLILSINLDSKALPSVCSKSLAALGSHTRLFVGEYQTPQWVEYTDGFLLGVNNTGIKDRLLLFSSSNKFDGVASRGKSTSEDVKHKATQSLTEYFRILDGEGLNRRVVDSVAKDEESLNLSNVKFASIVKGDNLVGGKRVVSAFLPGPDKLPFQIKAEKLGLSLESTKLDQELSRGGMAFEAGRFFIDSSLPSKERKLVKRSLLSWLKSTYLDKNPNASFFAHVVDPKFVKQLEREYGYRVLLQSKDSTGQEHFFLVTDAKSYGQGVERFLKQTEYLTHP